MMLSSPLSALCASVVKTAPPRILRYRAELTHTRGSSQLAVGSSPNLHTWRVTAIFDDGRARILRGYTAAEPPTLEFLQAIPARCWHPVARAASTLCVTP